ncbi:MAG: hypothetical protein NTX72_05930 [Candidatus Uhrbacteria bacterium]|nr:hypothetical protein [Candidatus Uhrbacteria bacterium]
MSLNELNLQIGQILIQEEGKRDVRDAILGLYEATTKLSTAYIRNKDTEEIERRIANIFIGLCDVLQTLDIQDPESILQKRILELADELNFLSPV